MQIEKSKIESAIGKWDKNPGENALPEWEALPEIELYMDQVITLMSKYFGKFSTKDEPLLTPSMINNYVKMGVIARPEGKKYGREQLAMLTMLVVLKQANSIEDVARLMNAEDGAGVREVYAAFCGYLIDSLREFADTLAAAGASALNLAVGAAVGSLACEAMLTSANPERGEKEKRRSFD